MTKVARALSYMFAAMAGIFFVSGLAVLSE
jgi:hypothetical protein